MTNEERDLITRFIERVGAQQAGGFGGPAGQAAAPLPPIDRDADALIGDLFTHYPEARYRITQMAFVQEHALVEAQNRIQRLEWELQQARQQSQPAPPPGNSPWGQPMQAQPQPQSRGLFGGLFGGAPRQAPPPQYAPQYAAPPPPQYPPGYNPGMFQQRGGSGFLGSALTTAAGVAGGMLAANALTSMFSEHGSGLGSTAASSGADFIPVPPASPWAAPSGASPVADPYDVGGADKGMADNSGWTNADPGAGQGGWQQPVADPGGWDDQQTIDSGGWSDSDGDTGGGSDDWT